MQLNKNKKKKLIIVVSALLGAALLIALVIFIINITAGKRIPKVSNKIVERKEEIDPVKSGYVWSGGPEDPKKIIIGKIGVDNFVQQVGTNEKNEVAAPTNIYLAGWYNKSAKPGQKGLSVIDGHLDGYTKPGVFNKLGDLATGDEFEVEIGSGVKKKFRVLKVDTVDTNNAVGVLFSQNLRVKSQLNLITCSGTFDKSNNKYDKRTIVSSELIN